MSDQFKAQMDEATYNTLLTTSPLIIAGLKGMIARGQTAKQIEKYLQRKYGNSNLTVMSTICAAYHIEAHPELLNE